MSKDLHIYNKIQSSLVEENIDLHSLLNRVRRSIGFGYYANWREWCFPANYHCQVEKELKKRLVSGPVHQVFLYLYLSNSND